MRVDPKNVLAIPVVSGDEATTSLTEAGASQVSVLPFSH